MLFALGYIAGIVTCSFVAIVLVFFKSPVERILKQTAITVASVGPKPTGAIFEPEADADIVRQELIERNKREGKDTPIEELQSL